MTSKPPDLHALVIRLAADRQGKIRATQGHLAHAAFLDILRQVDPQLTQALHDWNGRKPFTLSPLGGFGHGRGGIIPIDAGQEGWLRVTLLDPLLFQTFISYFLQGHIQATIRLGRLDFHVSDILGTPGSHPLAGYSSLETLLQHWETSPLSQEHQLIGLDFRSPTAFSIRNKAFRNMAVLPDPVLVFGQLATYWDKFTEDDTTEAVRAYASDCLVVARHKIATHMYQYRRGKQVGFTGRVHYRLLDTADETMIRHFNRLADLAFYTGLGSKTTMGMGQVIRIMKDEL